MKQAGIDAEPGSPLKLDAIRLPNKIQSAIKQLGDTKVQTKNQVIMSPTSILSGVSKIDGFFHTDDKNSA